MKIGFIKFLETAVKQILVCIGFVCRLTIASWKLVHKLSSRLTLKAKIIWAAILVSSFIYLFNTYFIYCNLAYTNNGFVNVAPEVKGYIKEVYIKNNTIVQKGDKILQIDPVPYQLTVENFKAQLEAAQLDLEIAVKHKQETQDSKASYASQVDIANKTLNRYEALLPMGAVSRESVDELINSQKVAVANLEKVNNQLLESELAIKKQESEIRVLKANLAEAEYNLSKTTITAATTGYINNYSLSVGEYLEVGQGICGIVEYKTWRVVANYQEGDLAHLHIGQKVLFYIPNFPWKIWTGKVYGIGHGVARDPVPQNPSLPYIEPVTDWIRYPYRFKVYISVDDEFPEPDKIFMGMSVYTLALP